MLLLLPLATYIGYQYGVAKTREYQEEYIDFYVKFKLWQKEQEDYRKLMEEWRYNIERPDIE